MKQVMIKKGKVISEEIPAPLVSDGAVLIKVVYSCISAGTELSMISSSGTPVIQRVLKQPEKVSKIFNMARSRGVEKVFKQVKGELDASKPVGYSISGVVIGLGKGVDQFEIGDRVAAAGGGFAYHAEYVDVPVNMVVRLSGRLSFREGSTIALGAIALHGVRRADLKLGEYAVVLGTGILGLLTVQMLRASGIRVIAIDLDEHRLQLAGQLGAELCINAGRDDIVSQVENFTAGRGSDAVLFAASTSSSETLSKAFRMCRRKGKVVLVGASGMQINRKDIYPKEIDFLISTSYGPGRYDQKYELEGNDYPYAYVRWTEGRNMSEYMRLTEQSAISLDPMISAEYPVEQAAEAFESLNAQDSKPLLVLLNYGLPPEDMFRKISEPERKVVIHSEPVKKDIIGIGLIGAGNFAKSMHLPHIQKLNKKFTLHAVADKSGTVAKTTAGQFRASYSTTDPTKIFNDEQVDLVLICTRHDSHAPLVLEALNHNKHVMVEKPLAISKEQLNKIEAFYQANREGTKPMLMVGFNRRFSPAAKKIKSLLSNRVGPVLIQYEMNAGYTPPDAWVHEHGGRIVGEACHIIDLFQYLLDDRIISVSHDSISGEQGKFSGADNKSMIVAFEKGSLAVLNYFALGSREYPKEHMHVHFDEKTILMDNYRSISSFGLRSDGSSKFSSKGHLEEWIMLHKHLRGELNEWPISLQEMIDTTRITLDIL